MRKKDISRILRQARDLMNQGGKHWTRGKLRKGRKEPMFCSVGALNAVLGRPNTDKSGYKVDNDNRAVVYALANEIRRTERRPPFKEFNERNDTDAMTIIWNYNDKHYRTWADIQGVFTRAAKNPVIPKP